MQGLKPSLRQPIRLAVVIALLAMAAIAAACSGTAKKAPDFTITAYHGAELLGGETVQFSSLLGKQPVVLNFWAGLCPPCRAEMPDFNELAQKYQGKVLIVGVDIGAFVGLGSEADGRKLVQELGITYPTGATRDSTVPRRYEVLGMPSTFFIRPDGTIMQKSLGYLSRQQMEDQLQRLLKESGA
jgi:thiol-disulfide isomerase/thioredoxin